jgi:hypothetical protein
MAAKRSQRASKSVGSAQPIMQMRQQHEAAEQQRKKEWGWTTALLAESKEIIRNVPGVKKLETEASATGVAAAAFQRQPTAADLELPSTCEFGLYVVEPSGPRSTQLKLKTDRAGEGDDDDDDSDENEYEYEQFLGELLASVPESAGVQEKEDKVEAENHLGAAVQELRAYEQAVTKAMERNAARAAAA